MLVTCDSRRGRIFSRALRHIGRQCHRRSSGAIADRDTRS
jgi:hypothetical protein